MNGSFVEELVAKTSVPRVEQVDGDERLLVPNNWTEVRKPAPLVPEPLKLSTLTGLVDYLTNNRDKLTLEHVVVHVASPTVVRVLGPLEGEEEQFRRKVFVSVTHADPTHGFFGTYHDHEFFLIGLMTLFAADKKRDELITLISAIKGDQVKANYDNGYAQQVTVSAGVALVGDKRIENPVRLSPLRSFHEIEQVESPFVLRLAQGPDKPKAALFEADGGAWKHEAVDSISAHLGAEFSDRQALRASVQIVR